MSQNNRQRRAAKKKRQRDARRREPAPTSAGAKPGGWAFGPQYTPHHTSTSTTFRSDQPAFHDGEYRYCLDYEFDDPPGPEDAAVSEPVLIAVAALGELTDAVAAGVPHQSHRRRFLALGARDLQVALDLALHAGVEQALEHGWSPLDLHELARRRGDVASAGYLIHICAEWTRRFPAAKVDRRWAEQLRELGDGDTTGEPSLQRWAEHHAWADVVGSLTDVAVAVMTLPVIEPVLPKPGTATAASPSPTGVDDSVLRRVRGLLARAESTEFDEEAAALSAKAQALMTRHSIDAAMASTPIAAQVTPQVRRVWLDAPYVRAKALLVAQVAGANRCRTVLSEKLGFVTLLGFGLDLDTTDLLSTSLLVQAERAVRQSGSQRSAVGVSRTRSFRQSFLVSFATRIGERLSDAVAATESAADDERGGTLLPVLASREQQVNDAFERTFEHLQSMSVSVSNATGWGAGRVAAELADLTVRPEVDDLSA